MGNVAIFKGKLVKFLAKAGILVPARGDIDRSATPTAGEMAFNTTANKLEVYNGTAWDQLSPASGGDPSQNINVLNDGAINSDSPVFLKSSGSGGRVFASSVFENNIYIGGDFQYVTKKSQHLSQNSIIVNSTNASVATGFVKSLVNGVVYTSLIDGDYIYLGGSFTSYNDETVSYLVKVSLITGLIDTRFNAKVSNPVYALAFGPNNDLYIGGSFGSINGFTRNRIASVNKVSGELNARFSHEPDATVYSICVDSTNNIYIAGSFFWVAGSKAARGLAKYNSNYVFLHDFNTTTGTNSTGDIRSVVVDDTGVYIGGLFTQWSGTSVANIAKLNKTTAALVAGFTSPVSGTVRGLSFGDGNTMIAVGSFTQAGPRYGIIKFDKTSGVVDSTFIPSGKTDAAIVNSVAVDTANNALYIGGAFGGTGYSRLLKLNLTTGAFDATFDTQVTIQTAADTDLSAIATVETISYSSSGKLYVGGAFIDYKSVNNLLRRINLVKYNTNDNTIDTSFDTSTGPNSTVSAISKIWTDYSTHIYIAGNFTTYKGASRSTIARINATNATLDTNFAPTGLTAGTINTLLHLPFFGDFVVVGGSFTTLGSSGRSRIGALNVSDGSVNTSFYLGTGFNGNVNTIISVGDGLVVGGAFTQYNGTAYQALIKLNYSDATIITAFNTTTGITGGSASVNAIGYDDASTLYIGGSFSLYKSQTATNICAINKTTGVHLLGFGSSIGPGSAGATTVRTLAISPNKNYLYIGGDFTSYSDGTAVTAYSFVRVNIGKGDIDDSLRRHTYSSGTFNQSPIGFDSTNALTATMSFTNNNNLFIGHITASGATYKGINVAGGSLFSELKVSPLGTPTPLNEYTLQASDINKTLVINSRHNSTIILPASLPTGFKCSIINNSEDGTVYFKSNDTKVTYIAIPLTQSNGFIVGGRDLNKIGANANITKDSTGNFMVQIFNRTYV
jgi:hypothetical protein